jgi:hypothetical protein
MLSIERINSAKPTHSLPGTQQQESAKTIWLVTYASGSPDLTHQLLSKHKLKCVECHTITWRESKYTLLRLDRTASRIRRSGLQRVMDVLREEDGIKSSYIEGYEALSSNGRNQDNADIAEHPGFRRMVQLLNERPHEIRQWMLSGDVHTNRASLLWNHIEARNPRSLSRGQLIQRVEELTRVAEAHTELKPAHEALQTAFGALEREMQRTQAMLNEERAHAEDFFQRLMEKIAECGTLRRQIITMDPLQPLP